jgi:nucleoside phosphorylase
LAIEEEGWVVGLISMLKGIPCIVIRGISDLAEGDKIKQQVASGNEEAVQRAASEHAAKVAVAAIEILSQRW